MSNMALINFISINARGLNTKEKRLKFYNWLHDSKIDIALIQETHFTQKNEFNYNCNWRGKSIHCFSDSTYSKGVSVLFKKDLDIDIINRHSSNDGRKILINVKIGETDLTLVNIYAPNNESHRIQFFKRMKTFINNNSNNISNTILCGDFNCKLNSTTDKSSKLLKEIIKQMKCSDLWEEKNKHSDGFTWCDANNTPRSRIDFVFMSENLSLKTNNLALQKIPGTHSNGNRMSDHKSIQFDLNIFDNKKGGWLLEA